MFSFVTLENVKIVLQMASIDVSMFDAVFLSTDYILTGPRACLFRFNGT